MISIHEASPGTFLTIFKHGLSSKVIENQVIGIFSRDDLHATWRQLDSAASARHEDHWHREPNKTVPFINYKLGNCNNGQFPH